MKNTIPTQECKCNCHNTKGFDMGHEYCQPSQPKSFFDYSDEEKKKIIEAAADEANKEQTRFMSQPDNWEEEFNRENWHAIEGSNGECACGDEKGICHERLKAFIRQLLTQREQAVRDELISKAFNIDDEAYVRLVDVLESLKKGQDED